MAESEMDSLQQKVLRRAQELSRLKAGKSSKTVSVVDLEGGNPQSQHSELLKEAGNTATSLTVFVNSAE